MLRSWLNVFHSLRALEFVWREWARQLGLDGEELLLLASLFMAPSSGADLAAQTGRRRQQIQRTLVALEHAGLAAPDEVREGRVLRWAPTPRGQVVLKRLSLRIASWERLVTQETLDHLGDSAGALVRALINCPRDNGWQRGLHLPVLTADEVVADSTLLDAAELTGELPSRTQRAQLRADRSRLRRQREEAEADLAFARLFR